jgi:prepilin-type N-terminal cleavage/methylation domain-containing protein
MQNDKGFTLIEMMIVMIIIGILAAIVIPNFIRMQDRAKEASVRISAPRASFRRIPSRVPPRLLSGIPIRQTRARLELTPRLWLTM